MKNYIMIGIAAMSLISESANNEEAVVQPVQFKYSTRILFIGESGKYLSDVAVIIRDKNGNEVISGVSDGPVLFADLIPGVYMVQAKTEGLYKTKSILIGDNKNINTIQFSITDDGISQDVNLLGGKSYLVTMNTYG